MVTLLTALAYSIAKRAGTDAGSNLLAQLFGGAAVNSCLLYTSPSPRD